MLPVVDVHHEAAKTEAEGDAHQKGKNEVAALRYMRWLRRQSCVKNFLGHCMFLWRVARVGRRCLIAGLVEKNLELNLVPTND